MTEKRNIQAILPLTPQQAALLVYCSAPGSEDLGWVMVEFDLHGPLDPGRWRSAWEKVVAHHDALRLTVNSPPGKPALSVLWKSVDLPWHEEDLGGRTENEQREFLDNYREDQRRLGIPLDSAPVLRVATFRLSPEHHRVCWTCHHLLLDGWSSSIIVRDVLTIYEGLSPSHPPSYQSYLRSLKERGSAAAISYWKDTLGTSPQPLRLASGIPTPQQNLVTTTLTLSSEESRLLSESCKNNNFTIGALARCAWSLTLHRLTSHNQITFGTVVSGRLPDVPGVDSLAGYFANIVPAISNYNPAQSAGDWLREIRDTQLRTQEHEHVLHGEILDQCGATGDLFDTLLVVQNLPDTQTRNDSSLQMKNYTSAVTSVYPLTITLVPGDQWDLHALYAAESFEGDWIRALLRSLRDLALRLATKPRSPLEEFDSPDTLPAWKAPGRPSSDPESYSEPRTATELELARIWEELLGTAPVGRMDNFFELGGRSLQALRLVAEIDRRLGNKIPASVLLQHATIADLAPLVAGDSEVQLECVVPIQTIGTRTSLFCIHAGEGHVLFYRDLALALGNDQPVYALQPVGIHGDEEPLATIEEMAERYVSEMRNVQPTGPYYLLGYCFGAAVALEIARQLNAQEESVANIFILDANPPNFTHPDRLPFLPALKAGDFPLFFRRIRRNITSRIPGWRSASLALREFRESLGSEASPESALANKMRIATREAFFNYEPSEYNGCVLFAQGSDNDAIQSRDMAADGWRKIAPNLEVIRFPFPHREFIVNPHVHEVAASIAPLIAASPGRE